MTISEGVQSWLTPLFDNQVVNIDFHHQGQNAPNTKQHDDVALLACQTQL